MEHRLWLCGQWFIQADLGKVDMADALMDAVEQLFIFLDYRAKFFGLRSSAEKELLLGLRDEGKTPAIREKLSEYAKWLNENRNLDINIGVPFRPVGTASPQRNPAPGSSPPAR